MIETLTPEFTQVIDQGPFVIRRVRPGYIEGANVSDPALGPLSFFDHATLEVGVHIPMHEHRNDEILSYMWRGSMVHEDSTGEQVRISPRRLMMMNAGKSFYHSETTPDERVEMLQILIRPEATDMEPGVQFYDRPADFDDGEWNLIAGPRDADAPLVIRNRVTIYDAHPSAGSTLTPPECSGHQQWLYVMDGEITVGDTQFPKGHSVTSSRDSLPELIAAEDSTVVVFLIDTDAPVSLAGNYSGYRP